jgi:hypothetical protein
MGQLHTSNDHFLASIGSISALAVGFRGVIAFIIDKKYLGYDKLFVSITASTISCSMLMFWTSAAELKPMYILIVAFSSFLEGG